MDGSEISNFAASYKISKNILYKTYNILLMYEVDMCMWLDLYSYENNIFIPKLVQLKQAGLILLNEAQASQVVTRGMSGLILWKIWKRKTCNKHHVVTYQEKQWVVKGTALVRGIVRYYSGIISIYS